MNPWVFLAYLSTIKDAVSESKFKILLLKFYYYSELKLNETGDGQEKPLCDTSNITGDASCAHLFGGNAKFCRKGECRCMLNSSYYANNTCGRF